MIITLTIPHWVDQGGTSILSLPLLNAVIYKLCKKLKLTDVDLECLRGMLQQFGGGLLNEENLIDNEPPLIV